MKQYVYKKKLEVHQLYSLKKDVTFILFDNVFKAIKHLGILLERYQFSLQLLKLLIKLTLKRNVLYAVVDNNIIVSDGVLSFGSCNYYEINKNDCVIGPVYTDIKCRGKGLATFGLQECLKLLQKNDDLKYVYIDTSADNKAMQSVIKKLEFSCCSKTYERTDKC